MLMIRRGNHERAIELLGFAQAQDVTDKEVKDRSSGLLKELETKVSAEAFAAALQRGSTSQLDTVMALVLESSKTPDQVGR
jgi:hypothetical protein